MTIKNIKILFRVSGGKAPQKQLGFGHAYRAINLAENFKKKSLFFLLEDYGGLKKLFLDNGFSKISCLKKDVSLINDIKKTQEIIKKEEIDILIIDKFNPNLRYIKNFKKMVKVIVISDLNSIDFPSDLVFNGFIGFKNTIQNNKFGTKCYLGPSYQILNKEFIKISKKKKHFKLLVTVGGYDEGGIIDIFLSRWMNLELKFKAKIILGPGTSKSKIVKNAMKLFPNHLEIKNSTSSMQKEITSTQFGLCAGGITTYEFASQNIPFAIISQNNHQLITAKQWEQKLGILNLGRFDKISYKKMDNFLDRICNNHIQIKKKSFVDGLGSKRIAKEINKLSTLN